MIFLSKFVLFLLKRRGCKIKTYLQNQPKRKNERLIERGHVNAGYKIQDPIDGYK